MMSCGSIPHTAPSQAAAASPAAGGEPPSQYLRSFLFPLGEHSSNLGVTHVTLQEGAFSHKIQQEVISQVFLLFSLVAKIQIFCKKSRSCAIKDIGFASPTFYHSLGNLILIVAKSVQTLGEWSQTGNWKNLKNLML